MKMESVRIVALREDRKRLLEHLQDSALIQVKKRDRSENGFSKVDMTSQLQVFERNVSLTETSLKILDEYVREKKGLLDSFKGRREIDPDEIGVIASNAGEVMTVCNRIISLNKKLTDNAAEKVRINTTLAQLEAWKNLDIPLNTQDTKSTAVFIGSLPSAYTEASLKERIAEENPKLEFESELVFSQNNITCFVLFAPISQKTMAEDVLRTLGFSKPMSPTSHTPKQKAERLNKQLIKIEAENDECIKEIISLADRREEIKTTQDYFRIRADKYNVINELDHTRHVFVINGYIPEEDSEKLRALCERVCRRGRRRSR